MHQMATPSSSQHPGDNKKQLKDSSQTTNNLSGLKHALHGASYQVKLGIVVCLANVQKLLDPANDLSFTVSAEDQTAGKFDDIVYTFKDGGKTGTLKIQAKHKLGSPPPNITVKDFTTTSDTKNPFAILKYFTSFCDQQQSITDLEGFVICTNADINDKSKDMWKKVEPAATNDSTPSLDSYVSSLFDSIGGKYYQLDYDKLWAADGTFSNLYQLLRKCSKRARLAKLLIGALNPNKKITSYNSLFKEYRKAILNIIDRNEASTNDSYGFTKKFLVLTCSNSKPGYNAFRKEFEDQYRLEFMIEGCVWDDLKQKRVYVSKDYLSDEKNRHSYSDSFPNDNVDESFKSFCERLRLVCGTYNEQGLDEAIVGIWRNWYFGDNQLVSDQVQESAEESVASAKLFKYYFNWLKNPIANTLHSDKIKKDFEHIKGTLARMKLQPISDKLRKKVMESPYRIKQEIIKASNLYKQVESKCVHIVEVFDMQFGVTVLLDILDLQSKDLTSTLFLDDLDFSNNSVTVEAVLRSIEPPLFLVIICHKAFKMVRSVVREWRKNILQGTAKQVFLIRKMCDIPTDLSCFCLRDLTEVSWEQFRNENITLCDTTISPANIFQNSFRELSIEEIIKLLDWAKQMEDNNEIFKKYREIERTYVHRPWIDEKSNLKAENIWWSDESPVLKSIKKPQREGMSLNEIANPLKEDPIFNQIFGKQNNQEQEHEPVIGDRGKKLLILLEEAGHGKSTNLTWLACHLRKRNPSSLVVRCNLSDHCTDFKSIVQNRNNMAGKVVDETEALKMLYKLLRSSLQLGQEKAEKCSKYLVLLDGEASVSEDLIKTHGLSLSNAIQVLVFKEKFNAGEIILLLDGFDEIAPHYKEVVLQFLFHFEQFKGVKKLYLTSRPYGFKEHINKSCKDPSFFKLKPLSLEHKGSILYKMMKEKWHSGNIENEEKTDFYKSVCVMILASLYDMSDVPLNLMMAADILWDHVYHNENINASISSATFIRNLFKTILKLLKPSFIVEEFVKVKIRHLFYDKNGSDKSVADKPSEIERFDKAIEQAKLLHGLVALRKFFYENDLADILSTDEIRQAEDYMKNIHEGREKTGIIHSTHDGEVEFIHRSFAEYLAAWCIIKRQKEGNQQDWKKMSYQQWFWDEEREELRANIDTILAKSHPLHVAIIERDWPLVKSLLHTNPKSLYEKDHGNRTPLHLFAYYYGFKNDWPHFLPEHIESDIINAKETICGWTALDYAFHRNKARLIFYLLHQGSSINADLLYEHVRSAGYNKSSATYAKYVMEYLSHEAIDYTSHDACKKMKQFCDKVVHYLASETSSSSMNKDTGKFLIFLKKVIFKQNFSIKEKSILKSVIEEDSVWMLESLIKRLNGSKTFFRMLRNEYFHLVLENNSTLLLKYFLTYDSSFLKLLNDDLLWKSLVNSVINDYKIEFKYFFEIYCARVKIKIFPCSIQNDVAGFLFDYVESNVKHLVSNFTKNIPWTKLGIPAGIVNDEKVFSLLVTCVATVRPSMLRFMKESCKLNLCAGIVYSLAMITNHLFSKLHSETVIKSSKAYECLLAIASNISDIEANKMLRLAIISNLFEFAKCLIERYNIDFQTVDELKGWNVFHLCASNQSLLLVEEISPGDYDSFYVNGDKTDLFRYMQAKASDMDCFGVFDRKERSILQLAIENEQRGIVEHIVARKMGLNDFIEIINLRADAIPNLTCCFLAIYEILKSIQKKWWHYRIICILALQIAKIALTNPKESGEPNIGCLLLQEHSKVLYQIAMKCRCLYLMYYLHREFPDAIPPPIYDADWLACTARSLRPPDFLVVTKWLLNSNEVDQHANLYEVVEKCDAEGYDLTSVNLEILVKQVEATVTTNRTVEEVCKLKLLALAVCLKQESMIRHLCETLNVNIDWKVLIDIMVIAHRSHVYKPGTKYIKPCPFDWFEFVPIYRYLFERTSNIGEKDAEGGNVLHLAAQSGLGCMAKFLIKHNMVNVMTTNKQNGWNIFHYFGSSSYWNCCFTENDALLTCIIKRVLENTSSFSTEGRKNKLKGLWFNTSKGRKSAIHVAVEAGNIGMVQYIIEYRLGIESIDEHEIRNSDECSRFRKCYDELSQIAAQLPFNARYDYLFHRLAKSIHRFSPENIEHVTEPENAEDHIVEDACRSAIIYRSTSTLEHLIIAYEDQMNRALVRSTNNELIACMLECIRQNRNNMFKVLVDHYQNMQGIQPRVEVEFEKENKECEDETKIDEDEIIWRTINQFSHDMGMDRDYLSLLILSVAYGRLMMTRYLVEMIQLKVNKALILLIMKELNMLWSHNYKVVTPVYEYLASRCEGQHNLLHFCIRAGCYNMLEYLIKEKNLDPNEVDSDNGWNAGHYCVSGPILTGYKEFTWLVESYKMDCFGVLDRNGRSILHLALDKGHFHAVKYLINHKLGLKGDNQLWYEWDLQKIDKYFKELQQILESVPENVPQQKQQVIQAILDKVGDRKIALTTYKQLFTNAS